MNENDMPMEAVIEAIQAREEAEKSGLYDPINAMKEDDAWMAESALSDLERVASEYGATLGELLKKLGAKMDK